MCSFINIFKKFFHIWSGTLLALQSMPFASSRHNLPTPKGTTILTFMINHFFTNLYSFPLINAPLNNVAQFCLF